MQLMTRRSTLRAGGLTREHTAESLGERAKAQTGGLHFPVFLTSRSGVSDMHNNSLGGGNAALSTGHSPEKHYPRSTGSQGKASLPLGEEAVSVCPQGKEAVSVCPQGKEAVSVCPQGKEAVSVCPQGEEAVSVCPQGRRP